MILFTSYYRNERQGELEFCLKRNCENPYIEEIILFAEDLPSFEDPKISIHRITKRPTYSDFFQEMSLFDGIKILSNSDIFFDESIQLAEKITERQAYCLTRHEYPDKRFESNNNAPSFWSQDCWFFRKTPVNIPNTVLAVKNQIYDRIPFSLGVPGNDNHIAFLLKSQFKLINPYPQIKAVHVHKEESRNYSIPWRITGNRSRWGQLQKVIPSKI